MLWRAARVFPCPRWCANRWLATLPNRNARQKFALRFLGQGHSGRNDVAERHEELLWRDLDPHASKRRQRGRG